MKFLKRRRTTTQRRAGLIRNLLAMLALCAGCYLGTPGPVDYTVCLETLAPTTVCENYYEWHAGYWTTTGIWIDGFYRLRPGYRHVWGGNGRTWIERDHRHWRH